MKHPGLLMFGFILKHDIHWFQFFFPSKWVYKGDFEMFVLGRK